MYLDFIQMEFLQIHFPFVFLFHLTACEAASFEQQKLSMHPYERKIYD